MNAGRNHTLVDPAQQRVPEDFPYPIVLGIDPGTRAVGYGALVALGREARFLAAGVIRPPAKGSIPERLAYIAREIEQLVERLRPRVVAVEEAFSARNVQSALRIGEARGVVLAASARSGASIIQLSPSAAKKSLVGNGRADKQQVARMVGVQLGLEELPQSLDATDALALALACVNRTTRRVLNGGA